MLKMKPAEIWGCRYYGKIGSFYVFGANGCGSNPLGSSFRFKRFPTKERVWQIFGYSMAIRQLVK